MHNLIPFHQSLNPYPYHYHHSHPSPSTSTEHHQAHRPWWPRLWSHSRTHATPAHAQDSPGHWLWTWKSFAAVACSGGRGFENRCSSQRQPSTAPPNRYRPSPLPPPRLPIAYARGKYRTQIIPCSQQAAEQKVEKSAPKLRISKRWEETKAFWA